MEQLRTLLYVSALALVASACGNESGRYGDITLAAANPSAVLVGETKGDALAVELQPGCAGYLDPSQPAHVINLPEVTDLRLRASSAVGPVSLVVLVPEGGRCDADGGSGHRPEVVVRSAGPLRVYVASLAGPQSLPYQVEVGPTSSTDEDVDANMIAVSVTSEPSGAEVRSLEGQVYGTTPAMFEVPRPAEGADPTLAFVLHLDGHDDTNVVGTAVGAEVVLHGALASNGVAGASNSVVVEAGGDPVPIRDFQTVERTLQVTDACRIMGVSAEVNIRHSYVGDLVITLHGPGGQSATLMRRRGGTRNGLDRTFTHEQDRSLRPLLGEQGQGEWKLTVRDTSHLDTGTLNGFKLELACGDGPLPQIASNTRSTMRRRRRGRARPSAASRQQQAAARQAQLRRQAFRQRLRQQQQRQRRRPPGDIGMAGWF